MTAKIFTWVGHPAEQSLSHGLMDAYESGATSAGAQIRRMNISEMDSTTISKMETTLV